MQRKLADSFKKGSRVMDIPKGKRGERSKEKKEIIAETFQVCRRTVYTSP